MLNPALPGPWTPVVAQCACPNPPPPARGYRDPQSTRRAAGRAGGGAI